MFATDVVASIPVCEEHFRLTLRTKDMPNAAPGQFVQVRCGSPDIDVGANSSESAATDGQCFGADALPSHGRGRPFTRRPFSIGGLRRSGDTSEIDLLYRVIGPGTTWMANLRPGQRVSVIGPLGKPFRVVDDAELSILVGGGIGLPPVMWLGGVIGQAGLKAVGVCGARSRGLLPITMEGAGARGAGGGVAPLVSVPEFGRIPVVVTTDDGSCGLKGTVIDGLRTVLADMAGLHARTVIYACGPEKMLRAVAGVAATERIPCQVCMERMMACGMGTCQSCVIRIRDDSTGDGWRYRLCCTDGPVFDADQVLW